ncbi:MULTISPECIES: hypothetical protein [unclassified Streptomyces]|uniref:hypothetical protein n=1 Tax=Streptomyces TaxID=1883 RepID=UPI000CD47A47|nr:MULTISPECIES: hypothetical protein [unclassified Streptomyces]POG43438.1 hypothetical protein BV881_31815 [Streptomyces sp. ZL-24]
MARNIIIAAGVDMSKGFSDFFDTIGLTGSGIVKMAIPAVLIVVALTMMTKLVGAEPKTAIRRGGVAVGALFVAVVLAMYGDTLFSTVTNAKVS